MKISICINADTRHGVHERKTVSGVQFDGCKSIDFLIDGVINKINFFKGFETEVILFIDEHLEIPEDIFAKIKKNVTTIVVRKHTGEPNFNDYNYYSCLQLARGDIIAHFDQDAAAFTSSENWVHYLINFLNQYSFVCYPSRFSPNETIDPTYNYMWASTRFFLVKKETLDFTEILKSQRNYEYFMDKYKPSRANHWAEHVLSLVHGSRVYYPPMQTDNFSIFCWGSYSSGTLESLNNGSYENVKQFLNSHPIYYPCNVNC
jgi:hypothetical protein